MLDLMTLLQEAYEPDAYILSTIDPQKVARMGTFGKNPVN
jgi:hypothetical protein